MREIIGWLTPEVGAAMRNLIFKTKPDVCVEIGVFAGKSLINTALALRENERGVVYGIDPWRKETAIAGTELTMEDPAFWDRTDLDAVHYDCMRAIWQHELEEYAVVIRTTSHIASDLFSRTIRDGEDAIDILYIDGGHTEAASVQDVTDYLPLVQTGYNGLYGPNRGGHIWLDDTNYDSLKTAIGIVEKECVLVKDFGHCRLYKKL